MEEGVKVGGSEIEKDDTMTGKGDAPEQQVSNEACNNTKEIDSHVPVSEIKDDNSNKMVDCLKKPDEFVIFHCVSYLGAAGVKNPKDESEIQKTMSFLNDETSGNPVFAVSVSVDTHSDGYVIVYQEETQEEIARYKINQIIFFVRGLSGTSSSACFAFTSSHGESFAEALFQCHAFRCDVPEAVGRVFSSFQRAFQSPPNKTRKLSGESQTDKLEEAHENFVFEVSLEIREDDGKGHFGPAPRDKGAFKLRSCVPKQIWLTIYQVPDSAGDLIVERCFGLLLSPGRHVRHSDMQLVETISWSTGCTNYGRSSYVVGGVWDINDPAFEALNEETAKDSCCFLTVAVDLVIKGIQEPIRFALGANARVYPSTERFWLLGRKHHLTQQFELTLRQLETNTPKTGNVYQVVATKALGEIDKTKVNFSLNFTSFIRSSSVDSLDLDTPTKEDEDTDDDEPLQSGMGEVSKDCTDEQISAWSDILANWPIGTPRPKHLAPLVKAGIPDTLRGEIWLRLADCSDDAVMFDTYKGLMGKDYENEEIILRDITRTFPANDYFKQSGGKGQEQLHRLSKGYALHDTEVGYCQGISFIGAALLLKMPEEQAFCLLVKIMFAYEFRDLYRDGFENLHLKLYQLDRLIEEHIPELWAHFQELKIESHMYASQWFLTLYTAKFPLVFVFRVTDLFLLDGTKTLFQVALALLTAARKDLLVLDFEGVLKYFRVSLPKKFKTPEAANILIRTATQTKVKRLKKYENEYIFAKEQEKNYVDPLTRLQRENKKLMEDMIRYESTITKLVLDKVNADENVAGLEEELNRTKNSLKEVEDFNSKLKEETNSVKELFQREMKQYDLESEKKSNIIADYKRTCSNLSSQLEQTQKEIRERNKFFQSNLCPNCAHFVSVAMNIASGVNKNPDTPGSGQVKSFASIPEPPTPTVEETIKMLENELAKTKISLAEAECRNDDLNHRLAISQNELEAYRNNASGPAWLWKNLSFSKDKDHKRLGQTNSNPNSIDDLSSLSISSNGSAANINLPSSSGNSGKKQ